MNILPNIGTIHIPDDPSREWIWYRILISIDYSLLKKPTALQWVILKILLNLGRLGHPTLSQVAKKLAVENSIVEEGITNLIEENLISLQPRKKPELLENYSVSEKIKNTFDKYELITHAKDTKKFILFYDYKDERTYSYQVVEKTDEVEEEEEQSDKNGKEIFELVLLAIIEKIWDHLENNPHILVGEIELPEILEHKFIKDLQSLLVEKIVVNFL